MWWIPGKIRGGSSGFGILPYSYGFAGRDMRDDASGECVSCGVVFFPVSTFARGGA